MPPRSFRRRAKPNESRNRVSTQISPCLLIRECSASPLRAFRSQSLPNRPLVQRPGVDDATVEPPYFLRHLPNCISRWTMFRPGARYFTVRKLLRALSGPSAPAAFPSREEGRSGTEDYGMWPRRLLGPSSALRRLGKHASLKHRWLTGG
jgi:hypothetical protein